MISHEQRPVGSLTSELRQLLRPQIRFLRFAGVTLEEFAEIVDSEFRRSDPRLQLGRLERVTVALANHCGILIANWKTLAEFLDRNGYPQSLALRGRNSFTELAQRSAPSVPMQTLLALLQRFGVTRKTPSGRIRLTSKVFNCTHPTGRAIAIEPSLGFLIDAAHVLVDQIDRKSSRKQGPMRYWREVEDARIPAELRAQFIEFSKRRVMTLMEEIEDWLDEHKILAGPGKRRKLVRVGIGLFAIAESSGGRDTKNA